MRSPGLGRHPGAADAVLVFSSRSVLPIFGPPPVPKTSWTRRYRYRKRVRRTGSSRGIPPFGFEQPFCGTKTVTARALRFGVSRVWSMMIFLA